MEDTPSLERPRRRWGRATGFLAAGVIAGSILAGTVTAGAQSSTSASTSSPSAATTTTTATTGNGSSSGAGSGETALTGTTAQKVRVAALAAVPGGTVVRVESDAGGTYEAHVRKTDGTMVAVKINSAFKVTSIAKSNC